LVDGHVRGHQRGLACARLAFVVAIGKEYARRLSQAPAAAEPTAEPSAVGA
jgi:hypothetical protein